MMRLDDLFHVKNGIASSNITIHNSMVQNSVPYIRPSSTQQRTLAGWVSEQDVGVKNVHPEGTLFVSTNGQGSHSYSYVSSFKFACNSDVSILLPKREMTLNEKVYYARCITMNRYKFSYGRKPKGSRLKQIELPDTIPSWVLEVSIDNLRNNIERIKKLSSTSSPPTAGYGIKLVSLQDIFEVKYGHSLELNRLHPLSKDAGGVRFVSRKMGDNGIAAYVAPIEGLEAAPAGELSCALSGNVLSTFYQDEPFYTGFHVARLRPLEKMSSEEMLFYCSCIWQNRYRFNYGRQANRTIKDLLIPERGSIPSWVYGSLSRVGSNLQLEGSAS